jgi:hypothetical protein
MKHLVTRSSNLVSEIEQLRLIRDLIGAGNGFRGCNIPGIRVTAWATICETGDNQKLQRSM